MEKYFILGMKLTQRIQLLTQAVAVYVNLIYIHALYRA